MSTILEIKNLHKDFGSLNILNSINVSIEEGDFLVLVGPSGCGKSTLLNCIAGLEPITSGAIAIDGRDMTTVSPKDRDIAMVFQSYALYPTMTVGQNITFGMKVRGIEKNEREEKLLKVAKQLQIESLINRRPGQLSGGQRQRVVIAMAIAMKPKLIIADEPSTALDVTTQAKLIKLLKKLVIEDNICLIMITHDLSVIAEMADKLIIMRNGEIVERGKINILKNGLKNDYSKNLLKASNYKSKNLNKKISNQTLLKVDNISRHYSDNTFRFFGEKKVFKAVKNVSFSINYNENVGLVGESGCGKSTITRAILGLDPIINGKIILEGDEIKASNVSKNIRKKLQVVFQDPYGSFNPRHNVLKLISEPLYLEQSQISDYEKLNLVKELLERVGLNVEDHKKFIHEFSGGQRQRIAIARSLILKPKLIILDEAVSALDVSIRAQILDLLVELSESYGLSYLFISHDLSLVKSITSRVLVMKSGQIVESGNTKDIFNSPSHAYTKSLIASSPNLESSLRKLS